MIRMSASVKLVPALAMISCFSRRPKCTRLAVTRRDPEALLQAAGPELMALSGADRAIVYLAHPRNPVLIPAADSLIRNRTFSDSPSRDKTTALTIGWKIVG